MKKIIITQEESFYIPIFLKKLLDNCSEISAIIILDGTPKGFTQLSYFRRIFDVFGFVDSAKFGFLYIHHRIMDLIGIDADRYYSVRSAAKKNDISLYYIDDINCKKTLELIKAISPEVIISIASPQIFNRALINSAKYVINIHASLLPKYRGMMPSFWALANGEERTGISVHYIVEKIDYGDILAQEKIFISPQDTLHSLQIKVANLGSVVLLEALKKIEDGLNPMGVPPSGSGDYYSLPTKDAAIRFREKGRKFI